MSTMPLNSDDPSTLSPSARIDLGRAGGGDGKDELLELAVAGRVMEGDPLDAHFRDDLEEVRPAEIGGGLVEEGG